MVWMRRVSAEGLMPRVRALRPKCREAARVSKASRSRSSIAVSGIIILLSSPSCNKFVQEIATLDANRFNLRKKKSSHTPEGLPEQARKTAASESRPAHSKGTKNNGTLELFQHAHDGPEARPAGALQV